MTFGKVITSRRKKYQISQRDLANMIKKEDGKPISPQYLNDIEKDRRNPPSEYLIKQFSDILDLEFDYLIFLAGRFPKDIQNMSIPSNEVVELMKAFRKSKEDKYDMDT